MGAHLIFFIIFTLFSCIILTNQSLPWYSLWSGFQCDTKMAAVFSCMRPGEVQLALASSGLNKNILGWNSHPYPRMHDF